MYAELAISGSSLKCIHGYTDKYPWITFTEKKSKNLVILRQLFSVNTGDNDSLESKWHWIISVCASCFYVRIYSLNMGRNTIFDSNSPHTVSYSKVFHTTPPLQLFVLRNAQTYYKPNPVL